MPLRGVRRRRSRESPWRRRPQEPWGPPRPAGGAPAVEPRPVRRGSRLVLAALLPAALAGGSSAALIGPLATPPATIADPRGPGDVGATGRLPHDRAPSPDLLKDAGDPRALATGAGPMVERPDGPDGIPGPMLAAYRDAAGQLAQADPSCGLHWSLLASIGRIESGHANSGRIDSEGTTVTAILGPRLNGGQGFAAITDTDGGRYDGDPVWDRAVGPMQFIPSTWESHGVDGNADGVASPHNVHDAAVSAGRYLCAGGMNMRDRDDLVRAVFRYNHSESYVREVLLWAAAYRDGVRPLPVEVEPEVDNRDVLAGHRLSYRPLRLAPAPTPGAAPPPAPRSAASPAASRPERTAPPPSRSPAPGEPAPTPSPSDGREPPSESQEPPSDGTSPNEPPQESQEPPTSETPPSESQEPPTGGTSPSEPPPSDDSSPSEPPSDEPPADDESGKETPPSEEETPPPEGETPPPSGEHDDVPPPCEDTTLLDSGRFVLEEEKDETQPGIKKDTTDPSKAVPEKPVWVDKDPEAEDGGGALVECTVPKDYTPPEK